MVKENTTTMGDQARLLERTKEYDLEALVQIHDRYYPKVHNYIYFRVGDGTVAEDLASEVFLKMLEALKSAKGWKVSLSAWLYRIAHNVVVDYYRQRREDTFPLQESPTALLEMPSEAVERNLSFEQLREAIAELTDEQQQVIALRFAEGLDIIEVARVLGKSEGAIKSLQHRALASLARIMTRRGKGAEG